MQRIAVIGLGRFGVALARQLSRSGAEVIAIDNEMSWVNEVQDDVAVAVRIDSTERDALINQEIDKVDVAVVAIGENFEAALLTTVILKKLGVPKIICRSQSEFHTEIFRQIGADEVIQPEIQAGERLGHSLANPQLEDLISLGEGYTLIEVRAPKEFVGQSIRSIGIRQHFGVNLITIRRPIPNTTPPQYQVVGVPKPEESIHESDILVLVGTDEALAKLPKE
ncbi:potassium channel family protein [Thalassoroseus pseudoceratinae]|uniref:potassium channel family protein n=1 Tax=Thalassoroseus pseudoceratinae TaxID=2713176 RepID=UPI001423CB9A|nr:TrkA family potassium uptake protein [Thalassoroseus pseudoceratinae]